MVETILSGFSQADSSGFIDTGLGFDVPKSASEWLALLDEFDLFAATDPQEFSTLLTLIDTAPTREARVYCQGMLTVVGARLSLFEERMSTSWLLH